MKRIKKFTTPNGYYYQDNRIGGIRHRDNDLPAEVFRETIAWYKNGTCHRDNGPAQIFKDAIDPVWYMTYFQNGILHRDDGPSFVLVEYHPIFAMYMADTADEQTPKPMLIGKPLYYFIRGHNITDEVILWLGDNNISKDHNTWTNDQKLLYKLTFG